MKKIFFILLWTVNSFVFAMETPPSTLHAEYQNALMHLDTIQQLYKGTNYQALFEYTRRFIEHPEQSSFVDVILQQLEKSEEQAVVHWAWQRKGKPLLKLAKEVANARVKNSLTILHNLQGSELLTVSFSQLYQYSKAIHIRAHLNHQFLKEFHDKITKNKPDFIFYPDDAP